MKFEINKKKYTLEEINKIWPNGVDVEGDIFIDRLNLVKIPFKILRCRNFDCSRNSLITLENGPDEVYSDYCCSDNDLTSLKGVPEVINRDFSCTGNRLRTLDFGPKVVKGQYYFQRNPFHDIEKPINFVHGYFYSIRGVLLSEEEWKKHPLVIENRIKQLLKED